MGISRTAVSMIVIVLASLAGCGRLGFSTEAATVDAAPTQPDGSFLPLSPTGTYKLANAITYTCASGLVDVNFDQLVFNDSAAMLAATSNDTGAPPQPCKMTGKSAATTGHIDVTCTNPGACNEIYHLTADFTATNHWSGMFEATFTGLCLDCTTDTVPAAATR